MKRVLIAEDEAAIREFIVINLRRGGYDVVEAEDGARALELYDACDGDIDVGNGIVGRKRGTGNFLKTKGIMVAVFQSNLTIFS